MLKVRVMPTLLYRDQGLVKGEGFNSWRCIGTPMQAVKVYNMRQVDELVFLDITATNNNQPIDFELIDHLADDCFMPFTVGGGIRSAEDVAKLLRVGADRIVLNSAAVENPDLVREIANRIGSQCVVVSIDARRKPDGAHEVFTHAGTRPAGIGPVSLAAQMQEQGAGEILLTSIERDGTMTGYNLELIKKVSCAVGIPVIASGGAGSYDDMYRALSEGGASAAAVSAMFHFTEQTPQEAKKYLHGKGINVRLA